MSMNKYPVGRQDFKGIIEEGFLDAYKKDNKPLHAIGINFSSDRKEVEELIWEEVFNERMSE